MTNDASRALWPENSGRTNRDALRKHRTTRHLCTTAHRAVYSRVVNGARQIACVRPRKRDVFSKATGRWPRLVCAHYSIPCLVAAEGWAKVKRAIVRFLAGSGRVRAPGLPRSWSLQDPTVEARFPCLLELRGYLLFRQREKCFAVDGYKFDTGSLDLLSIVFLGTFDF